MASWRSVACDGVIVYNWNETDDAVTSAPKDSFERDILVINCTIDGGEEANITLCLVRDVQAMVDSDNFF